MVLSLDINKDGILIMYHVLEYTVLDLSSLDLISLRGFPLEEASEQELVLPYKDFYTVFPYLKGFDIE